MFVILFTIAVLAFVWINPFGAMRLGAPGNGHYWRRQGDFARIWATIGAFAVLIVALMFSAIMTWKTTDITNSQYVIDARTAQRDELLEAFDDVLDSDEFVKLMEASVPDDILFLKTNPEISGFLLGRADRIVEVNQTLYAEQNRLLNGARDVCNVVQNPFIPQIPFFGPDCDLDTLEESFNR